MKAAQKMGARFSEDIDTPHSISQKGAQDFVTSADKHAEKIISDQLRRSYPDFSFLMEESGYTKGFRELTFIIDPLDGTLNFLHGVPHFAISIGLLDKNQPLAGVIYDPVRDELFWASKGLGAFMNQRRLRVSKKAKPYTHLLGTTHTPHLGPFFKNTPHTFHTRTSGSAVLDMAYVAAGRLDGFVAQTLMPWDQAAGAILVTEAGALTSSSFEKIDCPQPLTYAASPWLAPYLASFVSGLSDAT